MSPYARGALALAAGLIAVAALVPAAAALPDPDTRVTVHPGPEAVVGPASEPPEDHYYASADAHETRAPEPATSDADCSRTAAKPDPGEPSEREPSVRAWRPTVPDGGSMRGLTPECVWERHAAVYCVESDCARLAAHAAYDVRTGEYSLITTASIPFVPVSTDGGLFPSMMTAAEVAVAASGNSGVGLAFDCEECPTPP